jgi:hypothetical protein
MRRFGMSSVCAVLCAGALALSASGDPGTAEPAEIQRTMLDASDEKVVLDLLHSAGFTTEVTRSDNGAAEIKVDDGEIRFWIFFQACSKGPDTCEVITFSSGYDLNWPNLEDVVNAWNQSRYTKAYIDDENDPFIEFSINMLHGVTRENFVDTLGWFMLEVEEFENLIGWGQSAETSQPI